VAAAAAPAPAVPVEPRKAIRPEELETLIPTLEPPGVVAAAERRFTICSSSGTVTPVADTATAEGASIVVWFEAARRHPWEASNPPKMLTPFARVMASA